MKDKYYFGQGRVSVRGKDGASKAWRFLGDVSDLTLSAGNEGVLKHKENHTGMFIQT